MHNLTIKYNLPDDEEVRVYLNNQPCYPESFAVPDKFKLKLEQYRENTIPGSASKNFLEVLSILMRGGRLEKGSEISTPDRAIWESDCEISSDAEITVSLINRDGQIVFKVDSDSVAFSDTTNLRIAEPTAKLRWLGIISPFLILFSAGCIAMLVMVWKYRLNDANPAWIGTFAMITFTVLPICALFFVWYETIRRLKPKNKSRPENARLRKYTRTTVFIYVVIGIFSIISVAELLLPLAWNIYDIFFAPFPCALLMMVAFAIAGIVKKDIQFETGEVESAGKKLKKAEIGMIIAFATVLVMMAIGTYVSGA